MNINEAARALTGFGSFDQKVLAAINGENFTDLFDRYNCPTHAAVDRATAAMGCDPNDEMKRIYIYTSIKYTGALLRRLGFKLETAKLNSNRCGV